MIEDATREAIEECVRDQREAHKGRKSKKANALVFGYIKSQVFRIKKKKQNRKLEIWRKKQDVL